MWDWGAAWSCASGRKREQEGRGRIPEPRWGREGAPRRTGAGRETRRGGDGGGAGALAESGGARRAIGGDRAKEGADPEQGRGVGGRERDAGCERRAAPGGCCSRLAPQPRLPALPAREQVLLPGSCFLVGDVAMTGLV